MIAAQKCLVELQEGRGCGIFPYALVKTMVSRGGEFGESVGRN